MTNKTEEILRKAKELSAEDLYKEVNLEYSEWVSITDFVAETFENPEITGKLLYAAAKQFNPSSNLMWDINTMMMKCTPDKEYVQKIIEILLEKCRVWEDYLVCSNMINQFLGDKEWSQKVMQHAKTAPGNHFNG